MYATFILHSYLLNAIIKHTITVPDVLIHNYVDVPVVEITTAGGCGYINVSWTVIGNNDVCEVRFYTVTLLSFTMEVLDKTHTTSTQHIFSNLLYDTVFYVTIFSHNVNLDIGNINTVSVRTKDQEGTFICM